MKKFLFLLSMLVALSKTSNAVSFYSGISLGESKARFDNINLDNKRAFTFSLGSSFSIPLFPIRVESEYLKYNSKKEIYDVQTYGYGLNTYVNLPLLPILVPYIGLGLSYLKEKISNNDTDIVKKSDGKIVPQYIIGLDLDLPTVVFAGSMEYRYINTNFEFNNEKKDSKYHVFLFKTRLKF